MSLVQLVIGLVVAGVVMWLINTYIPMQNSIKKILNVVVIIVVIIYILSIFGVLGTSPNINLPR